MPVRLRGMPGWDNRTSGGGSEGLLLLCTSLACHCYLPTSSLASCTLLITQCGKSKTTTIILTQMPVQNTVPRTRSQTAFPPWLPPHTCTLSTDLYLIPLWQPGLKHQNRKYTLVSTSYLQIANVRPSNALLFFISKHKSF